MLQCTQLKGCRKSKELMLRLLIIICFFVKLYFFKKTNSQSSSHYYLALFRRNGNLPLLHQKCGKPFTKRYNFGRVTNRCDNGCVHHGSRKKIAFLVTRFNLTGCTKDGKKRRSTTRGLPPSTCLKLTSGEDQGNSLGETADYEVNVNGESDNGGGDKKDGDNGRGDKPQISANRKKKKLSFKFTSWNNTNEMNSFDLEKYSKHNDSVGSENFSPNFQSAYYSAKSTSGKPSANHTNIIINQELVNALSVEEIFDVLNKHSENAKTDSEKKKVFNEVNIVTAYHRIAKHVKNKNFSSKGEGRGRQGGTSSSDFDPVTFSLFETYSPVGGWNSIEERSKGEQSSGVYRADLFPTDEHTRREEDRPPCSNHTNLLTRRTYSSIYALMKQTLLSNAPVIPKHVANIAWASAILSNREVDIWNNIKKRFFENANNFKAQEISIILWSFSAIKFEIITTKEEFISVHNCLMKYLREYKFKAQEFSNVIWAIATSNCCNYDLLISLYNYALDIFDSLLLKDIATILYSLSIFAADSSNKDILDVIRENHLIKFGIEKDYLTICKLNRDSTNQSKDIFGKNFSYFKRTSGDGHSDVTINSLVMNQNTDSDKKYAAFLLFENFLLYSLEKITKEKDKMTMRTWSSIFWPCANIGLGLYRDVPSQHKLRYYTYGVYGNCGNITLGESVKGNTLYGSREANTPPQMNASEEATPPTNCKPYVHITDGEYVFPLMEEDIRQETCTQLNQKEMADLGISVPLDIYNRKENKVSHSPPNTPHAKIWDSNHFEEMDRQTMRTSESMHVKGLEETHNEQPFSNVNNNAPRVGSNGTQQIHLPNDEMNKPISNTPHGGSTLISIGNKSPEDESHQQRSNPKGGGQIEEDKYANFMNHINEKKEDENLYNDTNRSAVMVKLLSLFESQLKEKSVKWSKCEVQSIANILWSLSILNLFPSGIFENALQECNKRFIKYGKKKNSSKLQFFISQIHQSQLYQASFAYCLFLMRKNSKASKQIDKRYEQTVPPNEHIDNTTSLKRKIQATFDKYFKVSSNTLSIWKKQLARNQRKEEKNQVSSSVHKKISNDLRHLNIFHHNEYFILDSLLVDVYVPSARVAIEIDGPSHFLQKGKLILYNPNSLFKKRLLRALGFSVISISISEHTFMFSALNTFNFLKKFLSNVNFGRDG
ncbi:RAP protein, putative [Plasmodium knowlesi strain H]|uniref:RAP protein, putative n=3 Tax=Plasmodium knowlesi TaxID=5850 RepID=A0A5K1U4F3_PLAKH|nr:protein AMR2, putative [Plasmodium knowlesi strain H]OTN66922.1 putative RAP protein [Plasmodium knowlesi]CAA9988657.1 protein AMR2, putative [Plasmodium knowlesi strain H]SBO21535.1 RAP protein, putative [Plasmodium knowlesi strain H]SBO21931.1 RAP protein, putative [Plasmodium knowlesi strain H]VVS78131.1 protein AMR2, putative [Plasmodium knowlesi strain H]|eukprot:XP_002259634.1 RAP protein, putative [Plasmodium knowlesi strain H]